MSFIIAVLTGLGVGSGGLYILYLTLLRDMPQGEAQGLNLIFFIAASFAAAVINIIKKRVSFTAVILFSLTGILGTFLGAELASLLPSKTLSVVFGILLVMAGVAGIFARQKGKPFDK